jgi:peptidoglycan/xylan/chitin deacetylase (PgdA/CDA1 family)
MTRIAFTLFLAVVGVFAPAPQPDPPRRAMAVTIDDLPYVNPAQLKYLASAQRATNDILRALEAHRAPAVGFVNEGKLQATGEVAARTSVLKQWVDAGMTLGNHTYSHPDFNSQTVEQFEQEIVKGEPVTRRLMEPRKPYQLYFRHPMTHTGDTKEKKEAVEKFLASRGYRVAPHTIENSDFVFNVGYARARRDKDQAMMDRLRNAYLDYTVAVTEFAEKVPPQVFGREIPQTLLIHANDLNGDCLDELLKRFEARGYHFITLDEAMADPAYQTRDTLVSKYGPSWLWRWASSLGKKVDGRGDPEPPQWVTDLYNQR